MDPVEGTAELREVVGNSAEAPHLKRKENDQPPQQPESCNVLEHPAPVVSTDSGWPEHLSVSRSPESFLEVLAGMSPSHGPDSQSAPEQLGGNSLPSTDAGVMVEELTVKNYKSPDLYIGSGSSSVEESSVRKGLWHNLTRMAGRPRDALPRESLPMGNRQDVANLFLPQFGLQRPPHLSTQLDQNYNKVSEHLHVSDSRAVSGNAATGLPGGLMTKILASSGFPQIMVKSNLKGKGVAYRHEPTRNMHGVAIRSQGNIRRSGNAPVASDSSHKPDAKEDRKFLFGGGSDAVSEIHHHDRISLREWFKQRNHKFSRSERLHIFKQILELVDISHSQGLTLQHLRPSFFLILPTIEVKYMGSYGRDDQMERSTSSTDVHYWEPRSQRKRYLEQVKEAHLSSKHQKFGEHSQFGVQRNIVEEIDAGSFKMGKSKSDYRKQIKLDESFHPYDMPSSPTVSSFGYGLSKSEFMKLEERWYASPEELNEGLCSFSSNIYNLGVLLFELFCYSETWEVHSSVMSDLQHRILPPNFLSESPKEASFCLWLLHPEPPSRPNSRAVLNCDLISEGRELSSVDRSPISVDLQDAEADLLVHFLLTSKEKKEQQAAKLVTELGCLQADIEEIERRHSSRIEFLSNPRNLQTNFNGASDIYPQKIALNVEAMPIRNEESLIRNIDQLENAYFSIRFKINPSEINAAARSDNEVLKIRDSCFQVRNSTDVQNESTDRLGAFFEGLCKYARYSRFEVRGSLRNADILNTANVVCSLSFDRDEEYFAAAGVSKKIKIYEFGALSNDTVDIHYPMIEMSSRSRLSCVCWNSYIKNYLASTDYDGVVQLWDASTGQGFTQYAEHQKRAWSVDFSQTDPVKLASGSDDCSVKLWSINERNCIDTIRSVANICCVQFSDSSHLLAFGSADYKTYCYDLRNTRIPWCTLSGHGKAVSYVKFVDSGTLVSASTDNTLKLWDLNKTNTAGLSTDACSLTFSGHTNEKNFVGLSVSDGYIACGSETNEVYAYCKSLPMPITSHKFGSIDPITGQETGNDNGQFVSSVCWRAKSNMVVAANSSGSMKLLQLV